MSDQRDIQEMQEAEEQVLEELCQRVASGLATVEDACVIAQRLGLDVDVKAHGD